jgi:hypothetical protein
VGAREAAYYGAVNETLIESYRDLGMIVHPQHPILAPRRLADQSYARGAAFMAPGPSQHRKSIGGTIYGPHDPPGPSGSGYYSRSSEESMRSVNSTGDTVADQTYLIPDFIVKARRSGTVVPEILVECKANPPTNTRIDAGVSQVISQVRCLVGMGYSVPTCYLTYGTEWYIVRVPSGMTIDSTTTSAPCSRVGSMSGYAGAQALVDYIRSPYV